MPAQVAEKTREARAGRNKRVALARLGKRLATGTGAEARDILLKALAGVSAKQLDAVLVGDAGMPAKASAREAVRVTGWLLDIPKRRAAEVLGVSESRVSRNDAIDAHMLDRIQALAYTWSRVSRVLDRDGTAAWFKEANPGLDDKAPIELFHTSYGRDKVNSLVTSILYGDVI